MGSNQTVPLTTPSPSLALISAQDSAGSSGMEPRGTGEMKKENKAPSVMIQGKERGIGRDRGLQVAG